MTLVVARTFDDGVRVLGDTLLSRDRAPRLQLENNALKVVIIAPGLCVAFAGETVPAQDAFLRLAPQGAGFPTREQVLELLTASSSMGTDFLLAELEPAPMLTLVSDGGVSSEETHQHAGDPHAFESYQRALKPTISARGAGGGMRAALRSVISDPAVPSVGGFAIEARTDREGFRYSGAIVLQTGPVDLAADPALDKAWWDGTQGAYAHTLLRPEERGVGAIAAYFPHPGYGVLFHPVSQSHAYLYRDVSDSGFRSAVRADLGFTLTGGVVDAAGPRTIRLG